MTFAGTFAAVHGFLGALESLPRLARVSRLELSCPDGQSGLLEANVVVHVFRQHGAEDEGIGS